MKKSLMAILTTMVMSSMLIGAASASYIPDDVSYQNINGQQLAVKIYTLLPDQDPAALMENEFENDGRRSPPRSCTGCSSLRSIR